MQALRNRMPRSAPSMNVNVTWLLVLPVLVMGTWVLATMSTSYTSRSFRIKAVTPKWNRAAQGDGFVGHKAMRHLVGIHYKKYETSYRNYNASFKMMLHHPETDFGVSGSLINSHGAYEWKSHRKKIMTSFFDEVREAKIQNPLVLDVGAHIGATSLWLAALNYRVHAFEPASRNFALMHCSYVINPALHDTMWLSNVGLSDHERSGVCMKYSDAGKADAFITTERIKMDDYPLDYSDAAVAGDTPQEAVAEVVAEAAEERLETKMEAEAQVNQEKLDQQGAGRRLLQDPANPDPIPADTQPAVLEQPAEPVAVDVPAGEGEVAPQGEVAPAGEAVVETPSEEYYAFEDDSICDEYDVNLITLDWYWEHRLKKEQVTLLSLDVEGYEHKVLHGASRMFKEAPPRYVLMEVHPAAMRKYRTDPGVFYDEIRGLGYWLVAVDGQEIKAETWTGLITQQGRIFDTLWVRTQPPETGKFDWGLDYYSGMFGDYAYTEVQGQDAAAGAEVVPGDVAHTATPAGTEQAPVEGGRAGGEAAEPAQVVDELLGG